jgi:L-cysteine/cystine lyase
MAISTLEEIRDALPATRRIVYLNAGSNGPLALPAADAMRARVTSALEEGQITRAAFEGWIAGYASARAAFAEALNAPADTIALSHSVTGAVNLGLGGLDLRAGDEIVTTDAEHPGLDEPVITAARRSGVVVRRAAVLEGDDPLAEFERLVGPRTRVIAWSHVLWGTGRVLPGAEISELARSAGAVSLVDGAQAAGAMHVDVGAMGCDLYALPGQKWLCGPVGSGALYVRPGFENDLEIAQPGYLTRDHEQPGEPFRAGARRFDGASLHVATLDGVTAAIRWRADQVGWERGFELAATAAAHARETLAGIPGVSLVEHASPSSTLVSFTLDGWDAKDLNDELAARGLVCRWLPRPRVLRVSAGFWTNDEDVERLGAAVTELAGARHDAIN